jgi:putative MFS transporter
VIASVITSETDVERTNVERGAAVEARLHRIPASPYLWKLIALLSLGGFFEFYELFMTAFISPGLIRSGIFHVGSNGLFHMPDQASFASITFLGLLGNDHFGRIR